MRSDSYVLRENAVQILGRKVIADVYAAPYQSVRPLLLHVCKGFGIKWIGLIYAQNPKSNLPKNPLNFNASVVLYWLLHEISSHGGLTPPNGYHITLPIMLPL
jgi:hypothetical protein